MESVKPKQTYSTIALYLGLITSTIIGAYLAKEPIIDIMSVESDIITLEVEEELNLLPADYTLHITANSINSKTYLLKSESGQQYSILVSNPYTLPRVKEIVSIE